MNEKEYKLTSVSPTNGYVAIEPIRLEAIAGFVLPDGSRKDLPVGRIVSRDDAVLPKYAVGTFVMWPEFAGFDQEVLGTKLRFIQATEKVDDLVAIVTVEELQRKELDDDASTGDSGDDGLDSGDDDDCPLLWDGDGDESDDDDAACVQAADVAGADAAVADAASAVRPD